MIKYTKIH